MSVVLLYAFFLASVFLASMGAVYFILVSRGIAVRGGNGMPTPGWLHAFVFLFGCFGILASAPSIFSDNPHWYADKIYLVVSKVIAVFA